MSIESEILRIHKNIADTYGAVAYMGGSVPLNPSSENLAESVRSIPKVASLDGNPLGTIISYLGLTAPKDYLVCDGAEYSVSDYPALAAFFAEQFGAANYFGGDGTATFAVPDMRNLFLRGYHGESEEQLSGDIGVKQQATNHPYFAGNSAIWTSQARVDLTPVNPDTVDATSSKIARVFLSGDSGVDIKNGYTSRPINMAVLYCIKAVESLSAGDIYSTEETIIGTWIDGKPLYRKAVDFRPDHMNTSNGTVLAENVDTLVKQEGNMTNVSTSNELIVYQFPMVSGNDQLGVKLTADHQLIFHVKGSWSTWMFYGVFEYTKTTD